MNTKFLLLLFFLCFGSLTSAYSQEGDTNPISISDIRKGLVDVGYMRAILLENGFQLQSNKEEGHSMHEFWHIPNPNNSFGSFAVFQINKGESVSSSKKLIYCSFSYSTRKQLHPLYFSAMREDVYKAFPLKRAKAITSTTTKGDEEQTKNDYKLEYYSVKSPIVVSLDDDGNWAGFDYSLTIIKNLTNNGIKKNSASKK